MIISKICNSDIIAESYGNNVYKAINLSHVSGEEDIRRRHAAVCKRLASATLGVVATIKDTKYRRVAIQIPRCGVDHDMYETALRQILGDLFSISMGKTRQCKAKPDDAKMNRDIKKTVGVRWKPARTITEGESTIINTFHACDDKELRELFMALLIHRLRK